MVLKENPLIRSYREVLGVTADASLNELKKAYHRRALQYHPDRNPDPSAAAQFDRVKNAFEVLSNSEELRALNRHFSEQEWLRPLLDGWNICLGSFFGYRVFAPDEHRVASHLRLTGRGGRAVRDESWSVLENQSILDHPAYDAIEVVFAGRMAPEDEEELQAKSHGEKARDLPWVALNNQGLYHVFAGEFAKAHECYEQLITRVPGNLIFMYRLAVCELLLAYREPPRHWWERRPNRKRIRRVVQLLERVIMLGATRSVGRQKCLMVRKLLADVHERAGSRWRAKRQLKEAFHIDSQSIELLYRLGFQKEAADRAQRKQRPSKGRAQLSLTTPKPR